MALDILKAQESSNISQNTLIQETPTGTEDNKSTIEVFEENEEENPAGNNENLNVKGRCIEDAENDPNITNKDIISPVSVSQKEDLDISYNLKENIDSVPNLKQQLDEMESDNDTEDLVNTISNRRKSKKMAVFHSDSENEDELTNNIETSEQNSDNENIEPETGRHKKLKRITVIDSDSEDDGNDNSNRDSVENEVVEYKSVDQINTEEGSEENRENQKKILSALCDSESSDENNEEDEEKEEVVISDSELETLQSNEIIPKSRKGKQKQKSEVKEEKMTAKKALEQRKEILAESQRRVRESRVSLPYHKPKCRSLKEFLQNRPKLAAPLRAVSQGHSSSLSIKMSMKQLEVITQKMKEREKEVEEFYKSESESELEEEITNDNTETTQANEISSSENTEINQTDDSSKNELTTNDNNSVEKMDNTDKENCIVENTQTTEIIENENINEIIEDEKIYEKSEIENTTIITSNEVTYTEECEKNIEYSQNYEENMQFNENALNDVENVGNHENSNLELKLTEEISKSNEQIEKEQKSETDSGKNEKIVLISDILVKPTKSDESKNFYNLDAELLDLASEVEKDEIDQHDSYEFNLDDIEEESELALQNGEILKKGKMTAQEVKKRRLEMLEKIGIVKPRLSVGPNQIIDLENGIAMPDEISRLRERFIRHNLKSEKHSHKKEISILSVADGQIHKETVALKMDDNEEEDTRPLEKPGVRMQKLREELQHQMSLRRSDLWRKRLTNKNKNENLCGENDDGADDNEEKSDCDTKDILDNEEEEDFTDPEEELEENDCDMSEKKGKKSDFVDEEAEESEVEDSELDENEEEEAVLDDNEKQEALLNENEEEEEGDYDAMNEEEEEADVEDNEETADIEETAPKKKVLKRIIKAFEDDSDDENESNQMNQLFKTMNRNTNMDTDCTSENLLPSLELPNFKTREPILSPEKSEDHFATPVTYMTGLKNLNTSGSRSVPPEGILDEENPLQKAKVNDANEEHNTGTEKSQLDSQDARANQDDGEPNSLCTQDVLDICSSEFPSSSKCVSSPEISTQQLREVFTGSMKSTSDFNTQDVDDICSGGFTGVTQNTQEKDVALDDKDEHLISQLIDEDELENFKKKFESPGVNSNGNIANTNTFDEVEEVVGSGGVIDSDDEETGLKLKNKKRKRLAFSDDEESSTSETAQEETIDLHDDDDDDPVANVEYDSEENEIENTEDNRLSGENEKKKFKASDFFEEEAELSESEWGSADEDERNLDDLEFEKGDEEDFDQDKLRTDIEKLQMKQMLDEDNREVKMLQELLLEDGELHGSGRQRQFRWKNIDAAANENEEKKDDDDDVYLEEDESEEKWRKERHEREMLKLKKQSQDEEDSLIIESQSLSFTHKSLKIKSQTTFSPQVTSSEVDSSPKTKQPFALLNKRGSFLSRGEKILQRIAETSKVSFTNKNTNRIVFQTIDEETKKRKASSANLGDSTPVALKKLRLSELSPGLNKNRPRLGKSLFEKILGD